MLRKLIPLAALLAASALADPIQMKFTGVEGTAAFGFYVGPYYGQLEGQNVSLYCDDFANEVTFGQTWQANLSKITPGSDLSLTRFGGVPEAMKDYEEIAWLDTQFATQPTSQYGDIHATIWDIFDPKGAPKPASDYWLKMAQANYRSMTYENVRVITNVGPVLPTGQVQEFLTILTPSTVAGATPTPEPAAFVMMGFGLLGLAVLSRKLKRRAGKPALESV